MVKKKDPESNLEGSYEAIKCLGDVMKEISQEENLDDLEAVDRYTHELINKLYTKDQQFSDHIVQGYQALIQEASDKK